MAGYAGYSQCSIRFEPNNRRQSTQEYSDRSTIEIRQREIGDYILRAVDVDHNNTEIFNISLTSKRQYRFGRSYTEDELETNSGTYYLSLVNAMRKNFHKELRKAFKEIAIINQSNGSPIEISSNDESTNSDNSDDNDEKDENGEDGGIPLFPDFLESLAPLRNKPYRNIFEERQPSRQPRETSSHLNSSNSEPNLARSKFNIPHVYSENNLAETPAPAPAPPKVNPTTNTRPKLEPAIVPPTELLHNTHSLGKFITNGNANDAARIATLLCQQGVQIEVKTLKKKENDKKFTVQVQIDGNEYNSDESDPKISVDVYQSTTVRELRAAFELAYQQLPPSQYFFVNGALAHDDSSMKDLKVGSQSIFVLFLLTHPKKL